MVFWISDDPAGSFEDVSAVVPVYNFGTTSQAIINLQMAVIGSDACFTDEIAIDVVAITYSATGDCEPADPLSEPVITLGDPNVTDPCSCLNNAVVNDLQSGQFDELITIQADPGQTWTIVNESNLIYENTPEPPAAPAFIPVGEVIPETSPGVYELVCRHQDELGFFVMVENEFGQIASIGATCFYPEIAFTQLIPDYLCEEGVSIPLEASFIAEANNADATSIWFEVDGTATTVLDPSVIGFGPHTVTAYFDAGEGLHDDATDPACTQAIQQEFIIGNPPVVTLACNDHINVSLNENCEALITVDMLTEASDIGCDNAFDISIVNGGGQSFPNPLNSEHVGQTLTVILTYLEVNNSCWSTVTVEDKLAPTFDCPATLTTIDCSQNPDDVPAPIATDNCTAASVVLVNESTNTDDVCAGVTIVREWTAFDGANNQTAQNCLQIIEIEQTDNVDFPDDIVWSCDQYATNNNITDATAMTLVGLATNPDLSDALDATGVATNLLANTGSGTTAVSEGGYCNFAVNHSDDTLSLCNSANTFKIVRTWTVFNWCNNSLVTTDSDGGDNIQIIKIVDNTAPVITVANLTVSANVPGVFPQPCASTALLPAAEVSDNCSGVTSVEIYTPVGIISGNGGNIPGNGLSIGTHTVTYVATDGCGNTSEVSIEITVVDDLTPTAVCDELTQVAVGSDGIATVLAESFDDGSNDNCGIDFFQVRRMENDCADATNLVFDEEVTFCCSDIQFDADGQAVPVMVTLRVTDYYGNFNDCMVEVLVEDKLAPIKTNDPANTSIECDDYFVNLAPALDIAESNGDANPQILVDMFGEATYEDNCEVIVNSTWTRNVNSCGTGVITRSWSAVDINGNQAVACIQTITVNHVNDWSAQFPANAVLECVAGQDELDGEDFGEPTIFDDDCELIAIAFEDQLFDIVPNACYKILRTWTVINWCTYTGENNNDDTLTGTRRYSDGLDGVISYTQSIEVVDNIAPVITNPGMLEYCIDTNTDSDGDCDRNIELPEAAVTDCSPSMTVTYVVTGLGTGRNYTDVESGIYDVLVTATDNCGNQSTISYEISVRDCKAPTPYCVGGLVVELMPIDNDGDGQADDGMVEIWSTDFNAGSFDNCTAQGDLTFAATIGTDDYNSATANLVFDCSLTGAQNVYLYVTDEEGNTDYCLTTVFIESVDNVCPETSEDLTIAGAIATEEGVAIELTEVHINGSMNTVELTEEDGLFSSAVNAGGDYTVSPLRDDNHANGVTTYDLLLIRGHVLSTAPLNSPYKMIAADANNSQTITTSDIVLLRQLILTTITELPNNTSWRFVDESYTFPQANNPWADGFPEITNYNNVNSDILNADFVGIKVGDINGSVQANLTQGASERSTGSVIFHTQDAELQAGEEYTLNLSAAKKLIGAQYTLKFNTEALAFVGLGEEMSTESFGLTRTTRGIITSSVNTTNASQVNHQVIFQVLKNTKLSEALSINSDFTKAEAYDADGNILDIQLEIGENSAEGIVLLQNTPNPWVDATIIGFNLEKASKAEIRIHNTAGKTLRVIEQNFEAGYNEVTIDGRGLGNQEILFYTIRTSTHTATRTMIKTQ